MEQREFHFDVGGPHTDAGTKYIQRTNAKTVGNVAPLANNPYAGIRMEDYGLVEQLFHSQQNTELTTVVVADGHGSVAAYSENGTEHQAECWLGGFECAKLASNAVNDFVRRIADLVPLQSVSPNGMARILFDAFEYAQRCCEEEIARGAVHHEDFRPFQVPPPDRLSKLYASQIDGMFFEHLWSSRRISDSPLHDPRCLVVDKVIKPYGENRTLTCYVDSTGERVALAEYGCTLTAILLIANSPSLGRNTGTLWLAHTGDSDAYLFTRKTTGNDQRAFFQYFRVTSDHSTSNAQEVKRAKQKGLEILPNKPQYFTWRGSYGEHSLMPSRSIGHTLLSKHGITHEPTVVTIPVKRGDFVVVASDGLWSAYGLTKEFQDESEQDLSRMSSEDRSALQVCKLLDSIGDLSANQVCRAIRDDVVRSIPGRRDNLVVVTVKVN